MGVVTRDKSNERVEDPGTVGVKEVVIMEVGRLGGADDFVGLVVCGREGASKKEKSADAQGSAAVEDVTGTVVLVPALGVGATVTGSGSDWNMGLVDFSSGVGPEVVVVEVDAGALKSGKPPMFDFIAEGEDTISPQSSSASSAAAIALIEDIPRSIGVTLKGAGAGCEGVKGRGAVLGGCPAEAEGSLFQLNVATGGSSRLNGRCCG